MSTKTSRRAVLAGASSLAVVPLALSPSAVIAAPSDAGERRLMEIEAEIDRLTHGEEGKRLGGEFAEAETVMMKWRRRHPKQEVESAAADVDVETVEAIRAVLRASPNISKRMADFVANMVLACFENPLAFGDVAVQPESVEIENWNRREKIAMENCGFEEKEAAWNAHCDACAGLCEEAATVRTATLAGMKCKARIDQKVGFGDVIGASLVGDVLATRLASA